MLLGAGAHRRPPDKQKLYPVPVPTGAGRYVTSIPVRAGDLVGCETAAEKQKRPHAQGRCSLFRRLFAGSPASSGLAVAWVICFATLAAPAQATSPAKSPASRSALGGFVKDAALARVLGETLFQDTVDVMSDSSELEPVSTGNGAVTDNSAVGRVARKVLANRSLDKYLWLIRQAYSDELWKGGDRERIAQHFPLIWRTSIMLYESTLNASPDRVRVCSPGEHSDDDFDCRDEIQRARVVPIPSQMPLLLHPHQLEIG